MAHYALVTTFGPDQPGLIAEVAGCLFDVGVNLGDTSFAVLGEGAELTAVCELPDQTSLDEVRTALDRLPSLAEAEVSVTRFRLRPTHGPSARVTHLVEIAGPDRPGLVARFAEIFAEFGANIVRLDSERVAGAGPALYRTRFEVAVPPARARTCMASLTNTAGSLDMQVEWRATEAGT